MATRWPSTRRRPSRASRCPRPQRGGPGRRPGAGVEHAGRSDADAQSGAWHLRRGPASHAGRYDAGRRDPLHDRWQHAHRHLAYLWRHAADRQCHHDRAGHRQRQRLCRQCGRRRHVHDLGAGPVDRRGPVERGQRGGHRQIRCGGKPMAASTAGATRSRPTCSAPASTGAVPPSRWARRAASTRSVATRSACRRGPTRP